MEKVVIYGIRQQAQQLCFYIENEGCAEVAAFVVDREYRTCESLCGRPVVCFEDAVIQYPPQEYKMAVSFAYQHMIHDREEKCLKSKQAGYQLFTFVSCHATVFAESIGEGVIIYPGCNIAYGVALGDGNFLEAGVTIAHHTRVGNWNFFAPAATVCGNVTMGDHNFIGASATVIGSAIIGNEVLAGAGAVVHNAENQEVYLPARTVKWHGTSSEMKI